MVSDKLEDNAKNKLKRMKRIRKGRKRNVKSEGGIKMHEDKKSKKIEEQIEDEYDHEMRKWCAGYGDDYDLEDDIKSYEEEICWEEYQEKLKNKEDKNAISD